MGLNSSRVINIGDLRELARRRLPRMVFDYIDGGAEAEVTLRENCRIFEDVRFRPRSGLVVPKIDLATTVLGLDLALPIILGPVGSSRMFWPRGEAAASAAAGKAGTIYTLSTLSGTRLEEVKAATPGPCWYQVYLCGGREIAQGAIARAKAAGYSALVVTVDTPVAGLRERDPRNGVKELVSRNPVAMLPYLPQILSRPGWLFDFLADGGMMNFPNVLLPDGPMGYSDVEAALSQSVVCWDDMRWLRQIWDGPILMKGIHTGDDARRALDAGADAIVVSNHGGRQLDGVAPTLRVLPEIVAAVNGRVEVLIDGGIRRGSDVVKALALGARAVMIGRAYAYGLAAAGETGVTRALDILRTDMVRTMKLLACPAVRDLNRSFVDGPAEWMSHAGQELSQQVSGDSAAVLRR